MDRDVEVIHIERTNTVRTLRDQLAKLLAAGFADTGFPILRGDEDGSSRMVGFIGGSELEHALSTPQCAHSASRSLMLCVCFLGIVAEDADHCVSFQSRDMRYRDVSSSSISSMWDQVDDPFDFSVYMDKVSPAHSTVRREDGSIESCRLP